MSCSGAEPPRRLQKRPHSLTPPPSTHSQPQESGSSASSLFFFFSPFSFHLFIDSFIHSSIQRVPSACLECSPFSALSPFWILAALLSEQSGAQQSSDRKGTWGEKKGGGTEPR